MIPTRTRVRLSADGCVGSGWMAASLAAMAREDTIGRRIQMYRLRRGLTQEVLAGRVGRSTSWLSQVERGLRGVESWRVILDLAGVLKVDPRALVDRPLNLAPNGGRRFEPLAAMRRALGDYGGVWPHADSTDEPADIRALQDNVRHVNVLYQAAHYEEAGALLARLVPAAERTSRQPAGGDHGAGLGVLCDAYCAMAKTLAKVSETEWAWVAAERALAAAQQAQDEVRIAFSAYHLGHVFLRAGRMDECLNVTTRAAERLGRERRGAAEESLIGGLYLAALLASARESDRGVMRELLAEATASAERLGEDRNDFWVAFGPTNVAIHRLSMAVELGDAGEAERTGESIDVSRLARGLVGRRAQVYVDLARAYGQRRRDAAAVNVLLQAERLSPEVIRYNAIVRDLLRDLLRREHRASTPELHRLAERLGVLD